jgi:hypothetical protein
MVDAGCSVVLASGAPHVQQTHSMPGLAIAGKSAGLN